MMMVSHFLAIVVPRGVCVLTSSSLHLLSRVSMGLSIGSLPIAGVIWEEGALATGWGKAHSSAEKAEQEERLRSVSMIVLPQFDKHTRLR
jgi:hypothetical protein